MISTRLAPLFSTLLLAAPGICSASDVIVGPTDKAGFQAVLDGACEGDEIVCLGGEYDFSALGAVLIHKGVKIVADDSSNPPVFVGALNMSGDYMNDAGLPQPSSLTGNTAFAVPPGAMADGLEIEGLHLQGFNRGITTLVGFDFDTQGNCWVLAQPGSVNEMVLEGNHISNCGSGMLILGGPIKDFKIKNNVIDCSTGNGPALNVQSDFVPCGAPFANVQRIEEGQIKGNVINGASGAPAMNVAGVEMVKVQDNTVYGQPTAPGILIRDLKAVNVNIPQFNLFFGGATPAFGDDGPIEMGQIKGNTIHGAQFAIMCQSATTLRNVQIKGNTFVNSVVFDILLNNTLPGFNGSNGFDIKDNVYSVQQPAVAHVFLGGATFNNKVRVPADVFVWNTSAPGSNDIAFE